MMFTQNADFWSKAVIFWSQFKKVAAVCYIFPFPVGHIGSWIRQEYPRRPLKTFIPSFTRPVLAVEPTKWSFGQKGRFLVKKSHFLVKIQKNSRCPLRFSVARRPYRPLESSRVL